MENQLNGFTRIYEKEGEVINDPNFKIELKQNSKGEYYIGSIKAKANTIEEIRIALKELKVIAEGEIGGK